MLAICSLFKDRAWILPQWLQCMQQLDYPKRNTALIFLDDASADGTRGALGQFGKAATREYGAVRVLHNDVPFDTNNSSRIAEPDKRQQLYRHLARLRNVLLETVVEMHCDLMLSCDSDILIPPTLITELAKWRLPYVAAGLVNDNSEVFAAQEGLPIDYRCHRGRFCNFGVRTNDLFFTHRIDYPLNSLLQVGMSGACYLADNEVLQSGARYGWHPFGEDAWYCLELWQRDIPIYVDTTPRVVHVMEQEHLPAALELAGWLKGEA